MVKKILVNVSERLYTPPTDDWWEYDPNYMFDEE
jgi:hypothetical protein